jgi:hypothetical protein
MSLQTIPFGTYGYHADVHKIGDDLAAERQRLRDLISRRNRGVHGLDTTIEKVSTRVRRLEADYDRLVAEL